jgi:hypothetical protein
VSPIPKEPERSEDAPPPLPPKVGATKPDAPIVVVGPQDKVARLQKAIAKAQKAASKEDQKGMKDCSGHISDRLRNKTDPTSGSGSEGSSGQIEPSSTDQGLAQPPAGGRSPYDYLRTVPKRGAISPETKKVAVLMRWRKDNPAIQAQVCAVHAPIRKHAKGKAVQAEDAGLGFICGTWLYQISILIDTGADISLVDRGFLEAIGVLDHIFPIQDGELEVRQCDEGNLLDIEGRIKGILYLVGHVYPFIFYVPRTKWTHGQYSILVGNDLLRSIGEARLNLREEKLILTDRRTKSNFVFQLSNNKVIINATGRPVKRLGMGVGPQPAGYLTGNTTPPSAISCDSRDVSLRVVPPDSPAVGAQPARDMVIPATPVAAPPSSAARAGPSGAAAAASSRGPFAGVPSDELPLAALRTGPPISLEAMRQRIQQLMDERDQLQAPIVQSVPLPVLVNTGDAEVDRIVDNQVALEQGETARRERPLPDRGPLAAAAEMARANQAANQKAIDDLDKQINRFQRLLHKAERAERVAKKARAEVEAAAAASKEAKKKAAKGKRQAKKATKPVTPKAHATRQRKTARKSKDDAPASNVAVRAIAHGADGSDADSEASFSSDVTPVTSDTPSESDLSDSDSGRPTPIASVCVLQLPCPFSWHLFAP